MYAISGLGLVSMGIAFYDPSRKKRTKGFKSKG
ncbi:hypothetical protein [Enterococcus sp. AZ196]